MTEHTFENQDLSGARFRGVSLRDARMHGVDLTGVRITDAWAVGVDISGDLRDVRLNGVDVMPLVEAELDRIHPQRARMRPGDAEGFREAWAILEQLWQDTIVRASVLDEALLHERVDGEWSFVETLRHLSFGTAAWALRAVLGEPAPWHPTDLPHDETLDLPGLPRDRRIEPSLAQVLDVRADRVVRMRRLLAGLTDEQLRSMTVPVAEPGYPASESFVVARCLGAVINEHWEHRLYAERDLEALIGR